MIYSIELVLLKETFDVREVAFDGLSVEDGVFLFVLPLFFYNHFTNSRYCGFFLNYKRVMSKIMKHPQNQQMPPTLREYDL